MNVIAWLEYELTFYDSAVHQFNHHTMRTHPSAEMQSVCSAALMDPAIVKWFQVLLYNTNRSIYHELLFCILINGIMYCKWLNISTWPVHRTLIGSTIPGQSIPRSNVIAGVINIPQSSSTGASFSGVLVSYPGHSFVGVSYINTEVQSAFSTALAKWASKFDDLIPFPLDK